MAIEPEYRDAEPSEVIEYFKWVEEVELKAIASPAFLWQPCNKAIAAIVNGEIAGVITLVFKQEFPQIATIYVSKKHQRQGISTRLVTQALTGFRSLGCSSNSVFCDAITTGMSECLKRVIANDHELGKFLRPRFCEPQTPEDDAFAIGDRTGDL